MRVADWQIQRLADEARAAGDYAMVEVTRVARGLHGAVNMTRAEARAACARVICEAASRAEDGAVGPFVVRVEDRPMPHHRRGQTWTATGYGAAIPSPRVAIVRVRGVERARRVYVTIYSNAGTPWIKHAGGRWIVEDDAGPGYVARPFDAAARAAVDARSVRA